MAEPQFESRLWGRLKCVFGKHTWITSPFSKYMSEKLMFCFYCKKIKEEEDG